jgi:hypothetical protein
VVRSVRSVDDNDSRMNDDDDEDERARDERWARRGGRGVSSAEQ